MQIFLYIVDGKPNFRRSLAEAQAVLEDHLRDLRDVTDVWWDDDSPYEARKYMYGASHSDFEADGYDAEIDWETTEQIIWPVELGDGEPSVDPVPFVLGGGVIMDLTWRTERGRYSFTRTVPLAEMTEERLRPHIITSFAMSASQALADLWTSKERT
jgi:hypothetical protein